MTAAYRNQYALPLTSLDEEINRDLLAGGGVASTGIEMRLGTPVQVAINHSSAALRKAGGQIKVTSLGITKLSQMFRHIVRSRLCARSPVRNVINACSFKIVDTRFDHFWCQVGSPLQLHKVALEIGANDSHDVDGLHINHYGVQELGLCTDQLRREPVSINGVKTFQLVAYFPQHHSRSKSNESCALHVRDCKVSPISQPLPLFSLCYPYRSRYGEDRTYRLKPLGTCLRSKHFNEDITKYQHRRRSQQKHRNELPPTYIKATIQKFPFAHIGPPYATGRRKAASNEVCRPYRYIGKGEP